MKKGMDKRCNEPKAISDILHEMHMGKDDLNKKEKKPKKKTPHGSSKDFAEEIIDIITAHNDIMDQIDITREYLDDDMIAMEEFYNEEDKIVSVYKQTLWVESGELDTIRKNINTTQKKFDRFCKAVLSSSETLKSLIDSLPYEEDKDIQYKMIKKIILQFEIKRYDISEIISEQLELLQLSKKR